MVKAIILAGGRSLRLPGETLKQYRRINGGRMLVTYSLHVLTKNSLINQIIVLIDDESWEELIRYDLAKSGVEIDKLRIVFWKARIYDRQHSIREGIEAAYDWRTFKDENDIGEDDLLIIHDASKPMITDEDIVRCLNAVKGQDGAVVISEGAEQTPAVFYARKFYQAICRYTASGMKAELEELSVMAEQAGLNINKVESDNKIFNITTQEDWDRFSESVR